MANYDVAALDRMAHAIVAAYVQDVRDKAQYPNPIDFECVTVWQVYVLGNMKFLITTNLPDGKYYEVTYDYLSDAFYFDAYVRVHNSRIRPSDIMSDGEAPERETSDRRAGNRREERTALSADGIRELRAKTMRCRYTLGHTMRNPHWCGPFSITKRHEEVAHGR